MCRTWLTRLACSVRATEISQRSTEKADQEDPQRTYCTFSKGLLLTYHDIVHFLKGCC